MKKTTLLLFTAFAIMASAVSCQKEQIKNNIPLEEQAKESALLSINICTPATKAQGSEHGNSANDAKINTLEILIFNNEQGAENGLLEVYKNLSGSQLTDLSNIEITATTGAKKLFIIGNSHIGNTLRSITKYSDFEAIESSLLSENTQDFCMTYSSETTLAPVTEITADLTRLVARVKLGSLKTNFTGTSFEGKSLEDVKIYLLNAHSNKLLYNGNAPSNSTIFNYKRAKTSDYESAEMNGILYESISSPLAPLGEITSHYFYCYENLLELETETDRYTRLVIEGKLNGTIYYYPININREGFGYVSTTSHKGVKRNASYSINCTITGIGSNNPDEIIENSTISVDITVTEWEDVDSAEINF